jgi:hypothetical protein
MNRGYHHDIATSWLKSKQNLRALKSRRWNTSPQATLLASPTPHLARTAATDSGGANVT